MENDIGALMRASVEGVRGLTDTGTVIGNAIHTPSGVTVIPVSKLSFGYAGGGVDFGGKKGASSQSLGTGNGSGVSITPIAFLTVNKDAEINLIPINDPASTNLQKITSLIEKSPDLITKIKKSLS